MHYFKKNIGDYAKKTGRLSMLQHGSYTLLIDACYDREQFPTLEQALEWTWASSKEEIEAVEFVLKRFFKLEDGLYVQHRIREEIDNYHQKSQVNKRIANERETNRKENSTNRSPVVNEAPPNHKPRTINQEPKEKKSAVAPPPFELPDWINRGHWDAWHSCPKRKKATNAQKQMAVEKLMAWRNSGIDYAAALENAAIGGWQGLFKPDEIPKGSPGRFGAPSEPAWRTEQRQRTQQAAPGVAVGGANQFFEAEVKNVTPISLD